MTQAKGYFEQVYSRESDADFSLEAENYLGEIEKREHPDADFSGSLDEEKSWWF